MVTVEYSVTISTVDGYVLLPEVLEAIISSRFPNRSVEVSDPKVLVNNG